MKKYLITLEQFNPVIGNPMHNAKRMLEKIKSAKKIGSRLVLFGELSLSGYFAQDLFFNETILNETEKAWGMLKEEVKKLGIGLGTTLTVKNPLKNEEGGKLLFNQIRLITDEGLEYQQNKVLIPTYNEFDEYRWWGPGNIEKISPIKLDDTFIGCGVCEDGWNSAAFFANPKDRLYPEDPWQKINAQQLRLNINFSASPDYIGKWKFRHTMVSRMAKHFKTPQIFLNIIGGQDQLVFSGESFIFNSKGELVKILKSCEEDSFTFNLYELDNYEVITPQEEDEMLELDSLLGLYLKDYFRKSGLSESKIIIGLSGGIDSAIAAVTCARHLGKEKVLCIFMPYRMGTYTNPISQQIADNLTKKAGISYQKIPIDALVDANPLKYEEGKLAHQNIQARIRSLILWALANEQNRIVVNTTNWTEAALGYGTIGGDLLGLPLIASLPKTMVFNYARWLQMNGEPIDDELINRKPTAELAPGQFDEDELGDYDVIDPILIDLRLTYGDIRGVFEKYYYKEKEKDIFIKRFKFLAGKLLKHSQYKRDYYNRTPQFTPYAWLRWQWPSANDFFNINQLVDSYLKEQEKH